MSVCNFIEERDYCKLNFAYWNFQKWISIYKCQDINICSFAKIGINICSFARIGINDILNFKIKIFKKFLWNNFYKVSNAYIMSSEYMLLQEIVYRIAIGTVKETLFEKE